MIKKINASSSSSDGNDGGSSSSDSDSSTSDNLDINPLAMQTPTRKQKDSERSRGGKPGLQKSETEKDDKTDRDDNSSDDVDMAIDLVSD